MLIADPTGAALLAGVHAAPAEDAPRLVFADYLDERVPAPDPWAALIRAQVLGAVPELEFQQWRGTWGGRWGPFDAGPWRPALRAAAPRELKTVFGADAIAVARGFPGAAEVPVAYARLVPELVQGFPTVTEVTVHCGDANWYLPGAARATLAMDAVRLGPHWTLRVRAATYWTGDPGPVVCENSEQVPALTFDWFWGTLSDLLGALRADPEWAWVPGTMGAFESVFDREGPA